MPTPAVDCALETRWDLLPEHVLVAVAMRVGSTLAGARAMRGVCTSWAQAIAQGLKNLVLTEDQLPSAQRYPNITRLRVLPAADAEWSERLSPAQAAAAILQLSPQHLPRLLHLEIGHWDDRPISTAILSSFGVISEQLTRLTCLMVHTSVSQPGALHPQHGSLGWLARCGPALRELKFHEYAQLETPQHWQAALSGLTGLRSLSLARFDEHCGFRPPQIPDGCAAELPPVFGSLTQLTSLLLQGPWTALPPHVGALVNLKELSFAGAQGGEGVLPASLGRLTALTKLHLDYLKLRGEEQAAALGSLGGLRELTLWDEVPRSISRLTALTCLGYRVLMPPPGAADLVAISGCSSLQSLKLYGGTKRSLPDEFTRLQQLTCLETTTAGPDLPTHVICELPALARLVTDWQLLDQSARERLAVRGVDLEMLTGDVFLRWDLLGGLDSTEASDDDYGYML